MAVDRFERFEWLTTHRTGERFLAPPERARRQQRITLPEGDYLTVQQLSERGPWSEEAILRMRSRGIFKKGTHWFQPGGPRSKIYFSWLAVQQYIAGEPQPAPPNVVRLANGKEVNLDEAEAREASRLRR